MDGIVLVEPSTKANSVRNVENLNQQVCPSINVTNADGSQLIRQNRPSSVLTAVIHSTMVIYNKMRCVSSVIENRVLSVLRGKNDSAEPNFAFCNAPGTSENRKENILCKRCRQMSAAE
jgi:hypothetical protein